MGAGAGAAIAAGVESAPLPASGARPQLAIRNAAVARNRPPKRRFAQRLAEAEIRTRNLKRKYRASLSPSSIRARLGRDFRMLARKLAGRQRPSWTIR
ncbi:MAG TPA: hypothetical protein VGP64_15455 [Polyangia bacterium]